MHRSGAWLYLLALGETVRILESDLTAVHTEGSASLAPAGHSLSHRSRARSTLFFCLAPLPSQLSVLAPAQHGEVARLSFRLHLECRVKQPDPARLARAGARRHDPQPQSGRRRRGRTGRGHAYGYCSPRHHEEGRQQCWRWSLFLVVVLDGPAEQQSLFLSTGPVSFGIHHFQHFGLVVPFRPFFQHHCLFFRRTGFPRD